MLSGIDLLNGTPKKSGLDLIAPDAPMNLGYTFESYEAADPYIGQVGEAETKYGLPKNLLANVIHTESRFNPEAKSWAGAVGIAQIMPEYHPTVDPTDPKASIDYSAKHLKDLHSKFGNWDDAIAAYNMGAANLKKYGARGLEETRNYLDKINAAKVSGTSVAGGPMSGLDLLAPAAEAPVELPIEEKLHAGSAETFYDSMLVSPPIQGLIPVVLTPEITAYMGRKGFGPKPEGGWREDGMPLNKDGIPYFRPEEATGVIVETLQGISTLATHPMEVVRGGLDFMLSIPGFLTGLLSASAAICSQRVNDILQNFDPFRPIWDQMGDTTLDDLYNLASEKMHESVEFFEPGKRAIVGEPTPESTLAIQVVMAPLTAFSMLGHEVAGYEGFKNYPNIRGAAKFAGDILGFISMGMLFHSGSRAGFARDVESVVKEAKEISAKEQAAEGVPNEVVKQMQKKALEAEKTQLELKAKEISEKFSGDVLIREELARQAEEIARAKVYPVADTGLKKATEAQVKALFERLPEGTEPDFVFTSTKGNEYVKVGKQWYDKDRIPVTNTFVKRAAEKGKVKFTAEKPEPVELFPKATYPAARPEPTRVESAEKARAVNRMLNEAKSKGLEEEGVHIPEVDMTIKEVDEMTGVDVPGLKGEDSPFFQDRETTITYMKLYNERAKAVEGDPELLTQKLLNDANRWYHEDNRIDIGKVGDTLSMLAARADELRTEFITGRDHLLWKETVSEAAKWVKDLDRTEIKDRLKIEPTVTDLHKERIKRRKSLLEPGDEIDIDSMDLAFYDYKSVKSELDLGDPSKLDLDIARPWIQKVIDGAKTSPKITDSQYVELMTDARKYGAKPKPRLGGPELRAGIAPKDIIESARKVAQYTAKARGMKAFKPKQAAKLLKEEFNRAFTDRAGNIRKDLLDKLGDRGYEIIQAMYLSRGASSMSANMLKQMRKEVYDGLSKNERKILDDIVLADRMIDIGKYKTEKQFKHPKGMTVEDFVRYRQAFRYEAVNSLENLTAERAQILSNRAKSYFDWMKKPLKDMLDAELISEKEYDALVSHNYRRIKLVEVYDKKQSDIKKRGRTVYDSGVEALSRGRETDIYEPSSEIMALEVFNRAYGRILNNKANQTLLELARRDKENPFVRVKETKQDRIPTGWNRIYVFEKGKRKSMYLSPEMSKEWITSSPEMTYRLGQLIRYSSGSPVLRTFATGINWGFALANLPRDVMHTWYAARVFENGKWKPVYSSHAPIFAAQISRDLITTFSDATMRRGRYEKYIEEGGGMEFLVHQGRLFQRGRHIEGPIDAFYDYMGYFGETSEIMTRLAIRERVLRRRAKEKKISLEEARNDPKISREATFAARDYMDFGQGGWATKAVDNGIPYLNAAWQGSRGMFRAFKPGSGSALSSTYKLAQFATAVSGLYIASKKLAPKTMDALRGNINMQNNLCIPLGDDFGFEDEHGQMRYMFFKLPLDPGQKFFKTFFEAGTDKWLGNEIDVDMVVDSLKEQSPVGVTELPPMISGPLGYVTNKDFWLNEDIWRKTDKPFGYQLPKWITGKAIGGSEEEHIPGLTPKVYADFGALTGMSPERTKYAVEELTTSGTVWSYLLGKGYDATFGDLPKNQKEQHLAMVLSKMPVVSRFFGVTNPYSQYAQSIGEAKGKSDVKRWIQNRGLDMRAEGYLFKGNTTVKEIAEYAKSFKDVNVFDRLMEDFEFQVATKDLPNRTFWKRLKRLTTEARAEVYHKRLQNSTPEERVQMMKELAVVDVAEGVVTDDFIDEVEKLRRK